MRTQKKKEEDRLTAGVPGKFLLHSYSSDLRCSGVIIIIIIIYAAAVPLLRHQRPTFPTMHCRKMA